MSTASQLNKEIIASGLSRQAWFEQVVDMPVMQEGDKVWFCHKYGYTGMGYIWSINHDSEEVVIVNDSIALTLDSQAEWDTVTLLEKAEDNPIFAHISFIDRVKSMIAAIVA